jgi:hypothetical protein
MKLKIASALLFLSLSVFSQETLPRHRHSNAVWFGYFNSVSNGRNWNVNTDIQYRAKERGSTPSQFLVRSGLGYKLNDKVKVTIGVAHFRFYLNPIITRGEWRPWQEVLITDEIRKFTLAHRFRSEQRFHQKVVGGQPVDDYNFNWRFRYRIEGTYTLIKRAERTIGLVFGNEILVNAGASVKYNYFDQDRLYVGLNFGHNKKLTYQVEFMKLWQQYPNGFTLDNVTIIRLNIFHKINL